VQRFRQGVARELGNRQGAERRYSATWRADAVLSKNSIDASPPALSRWECSGGRPRFNNAPADKMGIAVARTGSVNHDHGWPVGLPESQLLGL
jgi:hypothetical protein